MAAALVATSAPAGFDVVSGTPIPAGVCFKTPEEWVKWRDDALANIDSPDDLGRDSFVLSIGCDSSNWLWKNTAFQSCMGPFASVASVVRAKNSKDYQPLMTIRAADYFSPSGGVLKGMLEIPPEIVDLARAIETTQDPDQRIAVEKKKIGEFTKKHGGTRAVEYTSNFLSGETTGMLIPGAAFDRWIHVLRDPDDGGAAVLMATIQKQDDKGKPIDPPRVHFANYGTTLKKKGNAKADDLNAIHRPIQKGATEFFCINCHRTGAMPIVPKAGTPVRNLTGEDDKVDENVSALNQAVQDTGLAVPYAFRTDGFRPAIGPEWSPLRTDDFLAACASPYKASKGELDQLRSNMNCVQCHSNQDGIVGHLSYPYGYDLFGKPDSMLKGFLESGHMPPGTNDPGDHGNFLKPDLKKALARCLVAEYYAGFKNVKGAPASPQGVFLRDLSKPCDLNQILKDPAANPDKKDSGKKDQETDPGKEDGKAGGA